MLTLTESDVFTRFLDKSNGVQANIMTVLGGKSGAVVLNNKLGNDLEIMLKVHKEPTTLAAVTAIKSGDIVLVTIPLNVNIPECIPLIKHKKNGRPRVLINLSRYIVESKDSDTGEIDYSIDVQKLYSLCVPGYMYLRMFDKDCVLSAQTMKSSAIIWARMFNKVLIKTIGLSTNKERYDAFMYFAIKFFLSYYVEAPSVVVESIAESTMVGEKSYLIDIMEAKIAELKVNPYESFTTFCTVLFNNEISNIKGIRVNNIEENINMSFYMKRFIDMYNMSAVGSLISFPYFIFTVFSSYNWAGIVNDRSMEDVVQYDKKEYPKLIQSLYKEM